MTELSESGHPGLPGAGLGADLLGQAGLADPGLAADEDPDGFAAGHLRPALTQARKLAVAPDELTARRRVQRTRERQHDGLVSHRKSVARLIGGRLQPR